METDKQSPTPEFGKMSDVGHTAPPPSKIKIGFGICFLLCALPFIVVGILFGAYMPYYLNNATTTGALTCSESDVEEAFLDPYGDCETCVPFYYKYSPFNVTNAQAVVDNNGSVKLEVKELGPYVYRKRQYRKNPTFQNGKVSYQTYNEWYFQEDMSCEGCTESDMITQFDISTLAVLTGAGGEEKLMIQLMRAVGGEESAAKSDDDIVNGLTGPYFTSILKALYGVNSMDPKSMVAAAEKFGPILSGGTSDQLALISNILALKQWADSEEVTKSFFFNGLFSRMPLRMYSIFRPSLLAGTAASLPLKGCREDKTLEKCAAGTCTGSDCFKKCGDCAKAEKLVKLNEYYCPLLEKYVADGTSAEEGKTFRANTCDLCAKTGYFCIAPIPGAAETTGLDFTQVFTENAESLYSTTVQYTGCNDLDDVMNYDTYENDQYTALWASKEDRIQNRLGPKTEDLIRFGSYSDCSNGGSGNLTCERIEGKDGASFIPAGASISGLADETAFDQQDVYINQALQNVTLVGGEYYEDSEGIRLRRFRPSTELLNYNEWNKNMGTGCPVDGVQNLAYAKGFLAYVSYPMYLYGDSLLYKYVDITMKNGKVASMDELYNNVSALELKEEYKEFYGTYVDVEPATGKTFRAQKKLMASFAVGESLRDTSKPLTDLTMFSLNALIITPIYIGEEKASITSKLADRYHKANNLSKAMLPVLIVGIIAGVILLIVGAFLLISYFKQKSTFQQSLRSLA